MYQHLIDTRTSTALCHPAQDKRHNKWVAVVHVRVPGRRHKKQLRLASTATEEDAVRLRCIGLLLLADTIGYTLKHMLHDAERRVGDDPVYVDLLRQGQPTLDSVVQRLNEEGKQLLQERALVRENM